MKIDASRCCLKMVAAAGDADSVMAYDLKVSAIVVTYHFHTVALLTCFYLVDGTHFGFHDDNYCQILIVTFSSYLFP